MYVARTGEMRIKEQRMDKQAAIRFKDTLLIILLYYHVFPVLDKLDYIQAINMRL